MIEVEGLYKSFEDKNVLENVNATFQKGIVNLIIGQSGSGKTVLMKLLLGLYIPDKGKIYFDNRDFTSMNEKQQKLIRQEIGTVFQGGALFDFMTVEENVMFPLNMFTNMTYSEKKRRVNFCLERVNLIDVNHLYPAELSGGMKKRVAIARAIVLNPKYLFCDEPNSGLDPVTANVIDKLLYEITHEFEITTIINTHDMNSVLEIGENILFIYKGKSWWTGTAKEILHTNNPELNSFIYATKLTQTLKKNEPV
ncbi:MAG: ATP-binding cassette domain-containing protein [Bacteroidales bacterium]|nr:ATP-binding cassette domain-containing protein [Bacteroidales bacterium]